MSVFTADKLTSWQASQVTSYVHEYTCHKVSRQHFLQFWMDSLGSVCQECIIHLADDSERPIFLFWECSFVCLFVAVLVWVLVVLLFCGGFGWLGVGGDSLDYIYIKNVSGKQVTSTHTVDIKSEKCPVHSPHHIESCSVIPKSLLFIHHITLSLVHSYQKVSCSYTTSHWVLFSHTKKYRIHSPHHIESCSVIPKSILFIHHITLSLVQSYQRFFTTS